MDNSYNVIAMHYQPTTVNCQLISLILFPKQNNMEYYFSKIVPANFADAIDLTKKALAAEGFGIISEIDMQGKLKEKLGVDYKKYTILGACNPAFAYKALQLEERIGTMLPCNVVIIDREDGTTEVAAVHPVASMMAVQNSGLQSLAEEVTEKLKKVINAL
jgi:uncharacterized protein (DUF302 family)